MTKKKMIATILLFLCFTGIVHASSIHGDYSGDPIVNVLFGGKTAPVSGPICREIMTNYARQMQEAVESYNGNGSSDPKGFEQYINKFKDGMNAALKSNHCPEQ